MAAVIGTAVIGAGVLLFAMLTVVMVALDVGVVSETSVKKRLHSLIAGAADSAVKLDACLGKSGLSAASDAAANKSIHAKL